jgi:hypothetical protein
MTSKLISPTNETPEFPPPNPPYNEELAVLLEERDEGAWKKLLQEVDPQFGNPIAAQIANIMHSRMAGEDVGKLIRKMLVDKAIADSTEGHGPEEDSEDEDPGPETDSDEEALAIHYDLQDSDQVEDEESILEAEIQDMENYLIQLNQKINTQKTELNKWKNELNELKRKNENFPNKKKKTD